MQQAGLLRQVSRYQAASLADVVNANRTLVAAQAGVNQALAGQQAAVSRLAARRAAVNKILSSQQGLLSKLETQAKQEAAAAASAAADRAQLVSQKASRTQVRVLQPAVTRRVAAAPAAPAARAPVAAPPASGKAAAALAFAYAQLGKAYHFGGAGISYYDCSGLTMRAYAAAGVSLAHSAAAQQHEGKRVSLSQLQPGDLVFYGNPAYHVGIYVGGGRMLDAPHTGAVVVVRAMWGTPSGAVRP
jgi:cell wall-associated NlpC family hydrolase